MQVEHGVTEAITGIDLVTMRIRIAAGAPLGDLLPDPATASGHAVEARVCAEESRCIRVRTNSWPSPKSVSSTVNFTVTSAFKTPVARW